MMNEQYNNFISLYIYNEWKLIYSLHHHIKRFQGNINVKYTSLLNLNIILKSVFSEVFFKNPGNRQPNNFYMLYNYIN